MKIRSIPPDRVTIADRFWAPRQRLMTDVTIPYMEKILRDEIPGAVRSNAFRNFRMAAGEEKGDFYGMVFQDSDVAKWLEAAAYSLLLKPDQELQKRVEDTAGLLARAQWPDGYLNSYFSVREPENRWTNLLECHELYCAGHILEAAAALHETGNDCLMPAAVRLADHIVSRFRDREGIPGHEEVEIGLERLYRATGIEAYLDMAVRFLNRRGQDPEWFRKNTPAHPGTQYGDYPIDPADTVYNQSDVPVRNQTAARGHAVRQMYLLTAMASVAVDTGDESLNEACRRMFDHITQRQMYVTGAVGSQALHESFSEDYDLPPDTMYGETCASVAMAFFARSMLENEADGKYADLLELELYNAALAGMQLDGTRFFYVNPLQVDPETAGTAEGYRHVLAERPGWYRCACCPPNLARLIASLGKYIWAEDETSVYCHLLIGSTVRTKFAELVLETDAPFGGSVSVTVLNGSGYFSLRIRIPGWASGVCFQLNEETVTPDTGNGYADIKRSWKAGDRVMMEMDMTPRRLHADPRVASCAGRTAIARGPLIYCAEGADNGDDPESWIIPPEAALRALPYETSLLGGIVPLIAVGRKNGRPAELRLIPYYAWSNRGRNAMRVWIKEKE